ncbi:MAG: twin-arginine translocase TatA/TatE family subunit [Rhodanobacter sp.]
MSIWHLLILAVVVTMVFGTGKLSKMGPDLGAAIRGFKKNLNGTDEEIKAEAAVLRADARPTDSNGTKQREPANVESK